MFRAASSRDLTEILKPPTCIVAYIKSVRPPASIINDWIPSTQTIALKPPYKNLLKVLITLKMIDNIFIILTTF